MREVRGPGAFADRPDALGRRLEPVVDTHVASRVELDARLLEAEPTRIGCTPDGDEEAAAFDALRAGGRARQDRDLLSRPTVHAKRLGPEETFDAFGTEDLLHFTGDVGIFLAEQLGTLLDDCHATAEAAVRLAELEADVTS